MLPIALQLYSVRDEAQKDFPGVLAQVKAMGYDGVELAGLYGFAPAEVKKLLDDVGLKAISAHVPYEVMIAAPEEVLGGYALLGCSWVVVPYMMEELRFGGAKYDEAIAGFRTLAQAAKALGMKLLYHNHDFEFACHGGKFALDILYETLNADLLETEIDTCWVRVAGQDPAAYVRKYTGRAPVVHLKDYYMESGSSGGAYALIGLAEGEQPSRNESFRFKHLGAGVQNIPSLLSAAADAQAQWVVVEQDGPTEGIEPLECARLSIEYLRSL